MTGNEPAEPSNEADSIRPRPPSSWFARIAGLMAANRDIYLAAGVTMVFALALILLQKAMLSDAEFIALSIAFASASFIAVVAQLGDDSDVMESQGRPLHHKRMRLVLLRVIFMATLISVPFCYFNDIIQDFGFMPFLLFTVLFALANWAYNLRRNQALMRNDNADFRNTSIWCAVVRLAGFGALAPFIGPYALVSEILARIILFPRTSRSAENSLQIAPFTAGKFVRSASYSTDALVQTQALTAVSMVATTNSASIMILVLRLMFYGTGALSQIVGTIFNRAIFQRRPLSFATYMAPGLAFSVLLMAGLWLVHLYGRLGKTEAVGAIAAIFAFLVFPALHPLSRLFTVVDREWVKLSLQLTYCGLVVWIAAAADTIWPVIEISALFSVCYAISFLFLGRKYHGQSANRQGDVC